MQDRQPRVVRAVQASDPRFLCSCAPPWALAWHHHLGWPNACQGGRSVSFRDCTYGLVVSSPCRAYADGQNWLGNRHG